MVPLLKLKLQDTIREMLALFTNISHAFIHSFIIPGDREKKAWNIYSNEHSLEQPPYNIHVCRVIESNGTQADGGRKH